MVLAFVLSFVVACDEDDRVMRATWAQEWLIQHFADNPLGHDWRVEGVGISDKQEIKIDIRVPDADEARKLKERSGMERLAILRLICPAKELRIWKILDSDQQIWTLIKGPAGDEVIAGSCKRP